MTFGTFFVWLAALLSTARLTHLLVDDEITAPLRNWTRCGAAGMVRRFAARALSCTWCTSIWVAAIVAPATWLLGHQDWFQIGLALFSISWLVSVLEIWADPTPARKELTVTHRVGVVHLDLTHFDGNSPAPGDPESARGTPGTHRPPSS